MNDLSHAAQAMNDVAAYRGFFASLRRERIGLAGALTMCV